jgi:hypothetical protein
MRTLSALVIATALCCAPRAEAQTAPDLTGTWTGKLACKGISTSPFLFGAFNFIAKEATLEITQLESMPPALTAGDTAGPRGIGEAAPLLLARLEAEDPDYPQPLLANMCGPVVVNPAKPKQVRAGLAAEGPTASAFAVDFSSVKTFPANAKGITGKLKGKGVLVASSFGATSGSCKWSFERTSAMAPADPPESCDADTPM